MKKLLLIDGNSLFFKSYFASYFLSTKGKEKLDDYLDLKNNGLRTFANIILLLDDENRNAQTEKTILNSKYDNIFVAFDHKLSSQNRSQYYKEYKGKRKRPPADLYRQLLLAESFLESMGIPHYKDAKYEADDIIGILSQQIPIEYEDLNFSIDVLTSDKDLLQLVNKDVTVYLSKRGISILDEYNLSNFKEKMGGLLPTQIPDLKSISGDKSDNIMGIKGIGDKGATKLLLKYESLENLLNSDLNDLTPSIAKKIDEGREDAIISRKLTTIITEGMRGFNLMDVIKRKEHSTRDLIDFLRKNELNNIANRINKKYN